MSDNAPASANERYHSPITIHFGLTYACNLNCRHCYSAKGKLREGMAYGRCVSLLDEMNAMGIFRLVLSHGESLLHPRALDFLKRCAATGIHTTLISNGIALHGGLLKEIGSLAVSRILISLDHALPERHDTLRGREGAWQSAVRAIEDLLAARANVGMAIALYRGNAGEIEDLIAVARRLGVSYISFMTTRPAYAQPPGMIFDRSMTIRALSQLWSLKRSLGSAIEVVFHDPLAFASLADERMTLEEYEWLIGQNACFAGKAILSVAPDGSVYPCNFYQIRVGNVERRSLLEVWNSEALRRVRDAALPMSCTSCRVGSLCASGCRAFRRSPDSSDARCDVSNHVRS